MWLCQSVLIYLFLLIKKIYYNNWKPRVITIILLFDTHRYDLLCLEGIAQALRFFNGKQEIPRYKVANISRESMIKMHVKPEVVISEFTS